MRRRLIAVLAVVALGGAWAVGTTAARAAAWGDSALFAAADQVAVVGRPTREPRVARPVDGRAPRLLHGPVTAPFALPSSDGAPSPFCAGVLDDAPPPPLGRASESTRTSRGPPRPTTVA